MKKRIILVGKGGSGKDYFKTFLKNNDWLCDISFTSRPRRVGEKEGVDYFYISQEEFQQAIKENFFHEAVTFNGWFYGTSSDDWHNRKVFIKTPTGISQLSKIDQEESLIVYFDIDEDTRRERMNKRKNADDVDRRLASDEADFKDFTNYDMRVTNPQYDCETLEKEIKEFVNK